MNYTSQTSEVRSENFLLKLIKNPSKIKANLKLFYFGYYSKIDPAGCHGWYRTPNYLACKGPLYLFYCEIMDRIKPLLYKILR